MMVEDQLSSCMVSRLPSMAFIERFLNDPCVELGIKGVRDIRNVKANDCKSSFSGFLLPWMAFNALILSIFPQRLLLELF